MKRFQNVDSQFECLIRLVGIFIFKIGVTGDDYFVFLVIVNHSSLLIKPGYDEDLVSVFKLELELELVNDSVEARCD